MDGTLIGGVIDGITGREFDPEGNRYPPYVLIFVFLLSKKEFRMS